MKQVNISESSMFKKCSKCGFVWPDRISFLNDAKIRMIGYQVHFNELIAGLFLFEHACGTSLAILAHEFQDLYNGPIFTESLTETEECPGYCFRENDLQPCPLKCECAYVREIIQVILNWKSRG